MCEFGGDDHAVMVAARTRKDADQSVGRRLDDRDACRQALKAAERHHHIFAVIGQRRSLQIRTYALNLLQNRPGAGKTTITPLAAGEGCSTDK